MISTEPKLTGIGKELLLRGIAGETISFTKMEIGNGELSSETDIAEMTALINPLITMGIREKDTSSRGYIKITSRFDSSDIPSDFRWREIGIYACGETNKKFSGTGSEQTFTLTDKPPVVNSVSVNGFLSTISSYDKETGIVTLTSAPEKGMDNVIINYPDTANAALYAYVNDGDDAGKLKRTSTAVVTEQTIAIIIPIGEASSVTAILSDSVIYATKSELDAHIRAFNPHGIDSATVGLGNVPNVSTNDQTPTYLTPITLSGLTSGETLSTAFGKLCRLALDFMSHINASNPHGLTASDINAATSEHTHSASDITSGTLSVSRGGTGASSYSAFKANSGITSEFAEINNTISALLKRLSVVETRIDLLADWANITIDIAHYERNADGEDNAYGYLSVTSASGTWSDGTAVTFAELPEYIESGDVDCYAVFTVDSDKVVTIQLYCYDMPQQPESSWGNNYSSITGISGGTYTAKIYTR